MASFEGERPEPTRRLKLATLKAAALERVVEGSRPSLGARLVPWTPVAVGIAYLLVFVARFPQLIAHVYSESDAAVAGVIARTAGGGTIVLERYGWFTTLWFLQATRSLPYYRQLWEVAPSLFALASGVLLGVASWRLAGRWAAAMTVTIVLAASPSVSFDRATLNYHTATWVGSVVLALYVLWLATPHTRARVVSAAALVALYAGATAGSDGLFALVGVVPLGLTGLLYFGMLRRRFEGVVVVATALLALPVAWGTERVEATAGVQVFPRAPFDALAPARELGAHLRSLVGTVGQLAGGNFCNLGQLRASAPPRSLARC